MAQGGMATQQTIMNAGLGGQQLNTVNLPTNVHHTSRSLSQSLPQQRTPSLSPMSSIGSRTTPLSGQVQMVSPPMIHSSHVGAGGNMMPGNFNQSMVSNPNHAINYQNNAGQIVNNQTLMPADSLEKYVTNNE